MLKAGSGMAGFCLWTMINACVNWRLPLLQWTGYSTVASREGREALALFERAAQEGNPFDAVILDLVVNNGMDGIQTALGLHKMKCTVPIIAASGYSHHPVMAAPGEYYFTDCINKPYRPAQLIGKLEFLLQLSGKDSAG